MVVQNDNVGRWRRWWLPVVALTIVIVAAVTFGLAVGGAVVYAQADAPATASDTSAVTPDQVNNVARELWCPLCSGVRLDACELKACDQMKDVIAIKLAEGEDTESIKAYFVEQYGPQVMGEPPRAGFNWLAWILPAVAVVVGGYFFWRATQRMMVPASSLAANVQPRPLPQRPASAGESTGEKRSEEEEYMEKLEEELAKYG